MDSNWAQGRRYRLVLRGELGNPFGSCLKACACSGLRHDGADRPVTDQAHLLGLIEQIQELGVRRIRQPGPGNGRRRSGSWDRTRLVMMAHALLIGT